jgi:NAD(P)-dependent dehydrogenase (short-subunit alcohol dehydrogenase family)
MSEFAGKVALITGGNSGIGRATAIEFAKRGAKVVVSGRREKEGHEVIAEIKALDGEAIFVRSDVSKESDVKALIERTLATFGRLDCAFNNAGVEETLTPLPDQTEETYDRVMGITSLRGIIRRRGSGRGKGGVGTVRAVASRSSSRVEQVHQFIDAGSHFGSVL